MNIRPFTTDQYELDKVFYSNYYKIKPTKNDSDVIVDIGAYVGYFALCAAFSGYKNIWCFEPFQPNYAELMENLGSNAHLYQIGVEVFSDAHVSYMDVPKFEKNHVNFSNTRLVSYNKSNNQSPIVTISLDELLERIVIPEVTILKINRGYHENYLLTSCDSLSLVQSICGESEFDSIDKFKAEMGAKGFVFSKFGEPDENGRILFHLGRKELSNYFLI